MFEENILSKIEKIINMFLQYLLSFSFPVFCMIMPIILSIKYSNLWMLFLYIITIPSFVVQRDIINEYKTKSKEYCDFWSLKFWDNSTWW